jgi:hypothetical protein
VRRNDPSPVFRIPRRLRTKQYRAVRFRTAVQRLEPLFRSEVNDTSPRRPRIPLEFLGDVA